MTENNRNQGQTGNENMKNQGSSQNNQQQNTTDQIGKGANPQDGDQWNNYRSRELSDQGGGAGNATTPRESK